MTDTAKDFYVVDFEFTQCTQRQGRPAGFFSEIIEIGAVMISGDTNEIIGNINIQDFVKPHFFPKHAKESMEFCSITEAHMKTAVDFGTMLKKIASLYVPGKTYFVTWGEEDYKVLKIACERYKMTNPVLFEDCLDLAAAYKAMKNDSYTTGLRNAAGELDITAEGHEHAAYEDALMTGEILLKLLADGWKPEHYFDCMEYSSR